MGHVERTMAEFIVQTRDESVPAAAVDAAERSAYDVVGCILAAASQPGSDRVVDLAAAEHGVGPATALGVGRQLSSSGAALVNGTLAHWLDFDDGRTAAGHAASVLLPAVLAIGEPRGVSGRELLTAYAIGLELATHISDACVFEEKNAGFHRTSLFGAMGATAAAARLHRLTVEQTINALGIVGSLGTGLCANFGSDTKPLHAGLAARNAVTAVHLAATGWTGTDSIFTGPVSWSSSYMEYFDYDAMAAQLGAQWRTANAPPLIKEYPCCGASHGPLDSLFWLMNEHGFIAQDVVEVRVSALYDSMVMLYREPLTGFQGKFSLLYSMATALVDGHLDVDSFTDAKLARPEYAAAAAKIRIDLTSKWDAPASGRSDHSRVKVGDGLPVVVVLKDGRTVSRSTPRIGGLQTHQAVTDKFVNNAARTLPDADVQAAAQHWGALQRLPDVRVAARAAAGAATASSVAAFAG